MQNGQDPNQQQSPMERFSAPVLKVAMLSALIGLAIIAARAGGVPYLSVELVLTVGAGILLLIVAYEIWMRQLSELFRYRLPKEEALNPEPVMVSDADGAIVYANKAAKGLLDARASVTIDGALADYLVSAKNIVFQLTQRLVDEHWVKETHSNRLYDVDIVARTLSHGFI